MAEHCLRMSNILLDMGLKSGDAFAIYGENSYEYMVCMLSGIFIGAIAVPIRGNDTIDELKRTVMERDVKLVALSHNKLKQLKDSDLYPNISGIVFGESIASESETHFSIFESLMTTTEPMNEEAIYEPKDPKEEICLLLESSGTTGLPKGCLFSHYNLVALMTIGSLPHMYNRTSDDVVSGHGYPAHIGGVNQLMMSINNGSQLILHSKYEFNALCAAIERYKITALSGLASVFLELLKSGTPYDISSLKKVICGGAPLPKGYAKKIVQKYEHFVDFRSGYGMTEMTILIAFGQYGSQHYDSVGPPTPGNSVKVIDGNTGEILTHDQVGEVCVTGPTLFKGYHKNRSATEEAIDCDHYMHTGDLGFYDINGNLFIVDRIKLLLKSDGLQVSPTELEALFLTHRAVKDVSVIGKPDEISIQIPTAFVVIKDEYKRNFNCEELLEYVNNRITHHKRIRGGIHVIDSIPKVKSGKTDRSALQEYLKS